MTVTDPSSRRWVVVFNDEPYAMRIIAVEPAPEDPGASAELHSDLYVACLSSYEVQAATTDEARRTARQLHDVDRIRIVRTRQHACRAQRRSGPAVRHVDQVLAVATQALNVAARDLDLTGQAVRYADAMATAALRAGYQHRAWRQRDLTFEQYVGQLALTAAATLFRYAALAADGRNDEAVALLVNALAAASSDL
ncbi:hypothetical protein OG426_30635 [Streptomyces canus]|uniref:hypothetical protein n=1 Tax=Streptomyces canus TaxID=58343 RepID=UPI003866B8AC|nr:hypothetical protein OG426_30635 [Streptomyces canus]